MGAPLLQHAGRISVVVLISAFALVCTPSLLPPSMDFLQLYLAATRALAYQPLYGLDEISTTLPLVNSITPGPSSHGAMPTPIPPWYVATFLPLATLSPETAAKTWGILNIIFLFGLVAISLPRFSLRSKAIIASLALLSAPVQGHLIIGQFTLLPTLGIAIATRGIRENRPIITAVGLALTTYKPHFGIPIIGGFLLSQAVFFQRTTSPCSSPTYTALRSLGGGLTVDRPLKPRVLSPTSPATKRWSCKSLMR